MEMLKCKACGSHGMIPMDLVSEEEQEEEQPLLGEQESRFYTCQVCGDNWLSIKQTDDRGDCQITFVHQMGLNPVLKRIAHMQTHIVVTDSTVAQWEYFLDDEQVEEVEWRDQLDARRKILKSICTN